MFERLAMEHQVHSQLLGVFIGLQARGGASGQLLGRGFGVGVGALGGFGTLNHRWQMT